MSNLPQSLSAPPDPDLASRIALLERQLADARDKITRLQDLIKALQAGKP